MGIPGFYKWLSEKYPLITKKFGDISRPVINNLYIDFNNILIGAQDFAASKDFDDLSNEILRYLDLIVQYVRPTTLIFIAIDGTPPYNKLYNKLYNKPCIKKFVSQPILNDEEYDPLNYKYSDVLPGAFFINEFQKKLTKFIQKKTKNDAAWENPQVIYSSVNNPGESEQKIFEFIRRRCQLLEDQMKKDKTPRFDEVHCIYSQDADIIPLILLTKENNFLLMRRCNFENNPLLYEDCYELVYINILREYLIKDYSNLNLDLEYIFGDWVFLLNLVGNDFFNGFSYFSKFINDAPKPFWMFNKKNFQVLMNLYEKNILKENLSLLDDKKEIDMPTFSILIKAFLESIGEKIDEDHFNADVSSECEKLFDNFSWMLKYYISGCPSWSYYYRCTLPLREGVRNIDEKHLLSFSDLYLFIQTNKKYQPRHFSESGTELTPFQYLLLKYPSKTCQSYLPNEILRRVGEYMDEHKNEFKNNPPLFFPYDDAISIVNEMLPYISRKDQLERNMSSKKFYIIEGGLLSFENLGMITIKPPKNLWIPSLNLIPNFFKNSDNLELTPSFFFPDNEEISIKNLNKEIAGKVILVDYPFLKPFLVERVSYMKQEDVKTQGVSLICNDGKGVLAVTGYPIVISSTNRSSIVVCSVKKSYPYCLTVPLIQKFNPVLNILESSESKIQLNHKVVIINNDYYGQIGILQKIYLEDRKADVNLINIDQPNLPDVLNVMVNKNDNVFFCSDKSVGQIENALDEFEFTAHEEISGEVVTLSFDDLIWEGKSLEKEQRVKPGNRVITITHGGPIEFGNFGTVIEYNYANEEVTVILDRVANYDSAIFGSTLNKKLGKPRGVTGKNYDFFVIEKKKRK